MEARETARRFFDAWNHHDDAALAACFTADGTYHDPATGGPLAGEGLRQYARGLWSAFPDLRFDLHHVGETEPGTVVAQWSMRGTNEGSFQGLPPTRREVELHGVDVVRVDGDAIATVQGYFDSRTLPEQLGLQVVVQPHAAGPFEFGTALAVHSDSAATPGAFSVTSIRARSDEEIEEIRDFGRDIGSELPQQPGFLGFFAMRIGRELITLTAWEDDEAARSLANTGAHAEAMRRFFADDGLSAGGTTGVWIPRRVNTRWVRCTQCGRMNDCDRAAGECRCGAGLPDFGTYL